MIPFEYLEHTADVKFRAYGKTPEEMLSNAAAALFKTMVDPATVQILETWKVELEAPELELRENGSWKLAAEIGGERIDLKRHSFENEVKAITMHQFQIKKNEKNDLWCIQVILDV